MQNAIFIVPARHGYGIPTLYIVEMGRMSGTLRLASRCGVSLQTFNWPGRRQTDTVVVVVVELGV